MIKRVVYIVQCVALLLVSQIMVSCFKDDNTDCPPQSVRIKLSYKVIADIDKTGIDPSDVQNLELFVFDTLGNYVTRVIEKNVILDDNYYVEINSLKPGKYAFVVWGNSLNEDYSISGIPTKSHIYWEDLKLDLIAHNNDTVNTTISKLYYGVALPTQVIGTYGVHDIIVPVIENTNTINLTVQGWEPNQSNYRFIITDKNGSYKFDNSNIADKAINYTTNSMFGNENFLKATLRVLRLNKNSEAQLQIYDWTKPELKFEISLIKLIEMANDHGAEIDYDLTSEYNITLNFSDKDSDSDMLIMVTVNNYTYYLEMHDLS